MAKKKSMPPWMKAEHEEMMAAAPKGKVAKGKKKKVGGKAKKKAVY